MAAVLRSPPAFPSSPASPLSCSSRDGDHPSLTLPGDGPAAGSGAEEEGAKGGACSRGRQGEEERQQQHQLSVLALLVAVVRKSLVGCSAETGDELRAMDIGRPTDVRHVVHVTFDRFHGFLGLPDEFEPEVPRRAPSASANVFGVSTESMQCSFDSRGNSVPTILLLMQRRLYALGGLQAEGIFRINAENSQEEHVRDQLNCGIVPENVDIHCLAGLIKCWFRELPNAVLDPLDHEQVMQCQSEEECAQLVRLLPPTEAALLDWAINLMADVVQEEHHNKMNARNIAMVFAPNMTKMADPLTALMYAVQVMNFLKILIERTLKERHESAMEAASASNSGPFDESGHGSPSRLCTQDCAEEENEWVFHTDEPVLENLSELVMSNSNSCDADDSSCTSWGTATFEVTTFPTEKLSCEARRESSASVTRPETVANGLKLSGNHIKYHRRRMIHLYSNLSTKKNLRDVHKQSSLHESKLSDKPRQISILNRINSRAERIEAW